MIIYCQNTEELTEICVELLKKGVTFDASTFELTIKLKGY